MRQFKRAAGVFWRAARNQSSSLLLYLKMFMLSHFTQFSELSDLMMCFPSLFILSQEIFALVHPFLSAKPGRSFKCNCVAAPQASQGEVDSGDV